jgi:hypothetical protein
VAGGELWHDLGREQSQMVSHFRGVGDVEDL